jgi:hypothetical protein
MSAESQWGLVAIISMLVLLVFAVREFVKGSRGMALAFLGAALGMTRIIALMAIGLICMLVAMYFLLRTGSQGPSREP